MVYNTVKRPFTGEGKIARYMGETLSPTDPASSETLNQRGVGERQDHTFRIR